MAAAKRKDNKGRVLREGESQRANGTYMYRYTDKFQARKCIYASDLKELREKEKMISAHAYFNLEDQEGSRIKVIDLVDRYCEASKGKRVSTQRVYKEKRNFVAKQDFANKEATKLKPNECRNWMLSLYEQGYKPGTVYGYAQFVKWAYALAIRDEILIKNPFGFKFNFLPESEARVALSPIEQERIREIIGEKPYNSLYVWIYEVLIGTGMRISEFAGLTIKDVDFEKMTISINKQLRATEHGDMYIERPKSAKSNRVIPMSETVAESLRMLIERANQFPEFNIEIDGHSGFIARSKHGKVLHAGRYSGVFEVFRKKYNERYHENLALTPHVLRHTFCTNMARKGMSVSSLQYLMGHSQASVTLNVYTHSSFGQAQEEFERLNF